MAKLFTLPSIAVLAVVGIGAGIHLGNGAANAINPFYSTPLPSRSHASLSATGTDGAPTTLSQAETRSTLDGCVGCRTEQQPMPEGYFAASLGAPRGYRAAYVAFSEPAAEPAPELAAIERYSSYPITETERELREIETRAAEQAERHIAPREQADALRAAEENASPRGTDRLIY